MKKILKPTIVLLAVVACVVAAVRLTSAQPVAPELGTIASTIDAPPAEVGAPPPPTPEVMCGSGAVGFAVDAASMAKIGVSVPAALAGRPMIACQSSGDAMPSAGRGNYSGAVSIIVYDVATNYPVITIVDSNPGAFDALR
jgi:hypothetical protein